MREKIKILSVCRSSLLKTTGTPLRIKQILHGLAKQKDFTLFTSSMDDSFDVGKDHVVLSNNYTKDILMLLKYIKKLNIDIVIGHTITSYLYLLPIRFFTNVKIVLEMHGFMEEEEKMYGNISKIKYLRNKIMYSFFYTTCNLITTCSYTATKIISRYNSNVVTIFGGVDTLLFYPEAVSGGYKKEGCITLGYAGNARKWQGLEFLIKNFIDIDNEYSNFSLMILLSEPEEHVNHPKIKYINNLPHDKVSSFLIDCDILAIPRPDIKVNRISFPSKLLEYMAVGKPIIASRTSDIDKIITDGYNGLLFEPGDKEGFKRCLLKLKDSRLREKLGNNAVKTSRNFSWDKQVVLLVNNIRKIIL